MAELIQKKNKKKQRERKKKTITKLNKNAF